MRFTVTMSFSSRKFVLKVINEYRRHPCLWEVTHQNYHVKGKRNEALNELLKLFKKIDSNANLNTVKRKLSSIRNCYRKELNKVRASVVSGTETKHVPKLWYYDELSFLIDDDSLRQTLHPNSVHSKLDEESFQDTVEVSDDDIKSIQSTNESLKYSEVPSSPSSSRSTPVSTKSIKRNFSSDPSSSRSTSVSRKILKRNFSNDPLSPEICKNNESSASSPVPTKPKYTAYGEHIAEKLRSMPPLMATYCQKIINDAIFMAETNNLDITSHIVVR